MSNLTRLVEDKVDEVVESLDFATDALGEAGNYIEAAMSGWRQLPHDLLAPFDKARLSLALSRAIEECEEFVEIYRGPQGE